MKKRIILFGILVLSDFIAQSQNNIVEKVIEKNSNIHNVSYMLFMYSNMFLSETRDTMQTYIQVNQNRTDDVYNRYKFEYLGKNQITICDGDRSVNIFYKQRQYFVNKDKGQYDRSLLTYWIAECRSLLKKQKVVYLADTLINGKKYIPFILKYSPFSTLNNKKRGHEVLFLIDKKTYLPYFIKDELKAEVGDWTFEYKYSQFVFNKRVFPDLSISIPSNFTDAEKDADSKRSKIKTLDSGMLAPNFQLYDTNGGLIDFSKIREKKVSLIEFSSVACGHCYEALLDLKKLRAKFGTSELAIMTIYDNALSPKGKVKDIIEKYNIDQDMLMLIDGEGVAEKYGKRLWPHYFLIDVEGRIITSGIGSDSFQRISTLIEKQLKKQNSR